MKSNKIIFASILCFTSFLLIYGITARSNLRYTDEVAVFATGISWVTEGDLAIDELQWIQDVVNIGDIGQDGHLYAKYFPGNIFSSAIIYKLAQKQNDKPYLWEARDLNPTIGPVELASSDSGARLAMKLNTIFGALAMTSLYLIVRRYYDNRVALISVIIIGLSTQWWYESRGFFSEVGAGALLITSLCFAVYQSPYQSALALGISILFRPTNLLGFPIWLKTLRDHGIKTIWSGILIAVGLAMLLLYNWIRFHSILNFGYGDESFESNLLLGLAGTLFSPGRSILLYSPILCLAIPGMLAFYKKDWAFTIVCAIIVTAHIMLISSWHSWDGGWSWGSRLLTPIIPILGIFTAPVIDAARNNKRDMLLILLLALLGLCIQLLALSNDPLKNLVNSVVYGEINYGDTIFTIKNSWLSIQLKSLAHWNCCNIDAYTLRQWFGSCQ